MRAATPAVLRTSANFVKAGYEFLSASVDLHIHPGQSNNRLC